MIKLSNRLNKLASFIDKDDNVIDIGCDHALLDIYLCEKYNKKYYASDLRSNVIELAKENVKKYNVKDYVELRCGNGLDVIEEKDNIDTVVISGMGYYTIVGILKDKNKYKSINKMVISSNTNPKFVRMYLIKNGFYIEKETVVLDKNISYIITCYKRGKKKYSKMDIEIGMLDNSPDTLKYLDVEIKKNNILLSIIPFKNIIKRYKITKIKKLLIKKKDSIK